MKAVILGILLTASPATVFAINLTAADSDAAMKIRWMQGASGTDHSRLAAYVQADQVFSQWCDRVATARDLMRISGQENFRSFYEKLKTGQISGMTQAKSMLLNNNPQFCKDKL